MTNEITKAATGGMVTKEYLKQQQELLSMFNMKGFYALEHYEVIVSGDGRKVLRKRANPIKVVDDGDNASIVAVMSKTLGERFFKREREEDRLELINPSCNLEVKECLGEW